MFIILCCRCNLPYRGGPQYRNKWALGIVQHRGPVIEGNGGPSLNHARGSKKDKIARQTFAEITVSMWFQGKRRFLGQSPKPREARSRPRKQKTGNPVFGQECRHWEIGVREFVLVSQHCQKMTHNGNIQRQANHQKNKFDIGRLESIACTPKSTKEEHTQPTSKH